MAQRLIKTNFLKHNIDDTLTVAKSVFLLQANIITVIADTTVSSLRLEYNSDGMHDAAILDTYHVDSVSTGYNGNTIVLSCISLNGVAFPSPTTVTFILDNIRIIEPDPNGGAGARVHYVKREKAGHVAFGYADTATTYANIHTVIA